MASTTRDEFEWTPERLQMARSYAGGAWDKPRMIEEVVESAYSDAAWSLDEFREVLDSVPAEFADTARVVFESDPYDGGAWLKVTYARQETPEEVTKHVAKIAAYVLEQEAEERADYVRLKAKFGK